MDGIMAYIPQIQLQPLQDSLKEAPVVVLFGPRQVGKTTLVKKFLESCPEPHHFVTGDDLGVRETLSSPRLQPLLEFMGDKNLLVIDEAQRIPSLGLTLKLLVDARPHIRVVATGSSSFDLARSMGEPLTGRKRTLHLYPLAQMEIGKTERPDQTRSALPFRLIYGSYPEAVLTVGEQKKQAFLKELVASSLYKDILELEGLRHPKKIIQLLQLLAFQIGKEVSLQELAVNLQMGKNTVEKYLDLLEKTFVLVNVRGFSRNLRSEVTKTSRYYFTDTGVRNTLINNFNPLTLRDDVGALWENYLAMERLKAQTYLSRPANNYFWRTYARSEIDWVEDRAGILTGYEFTWSPARAKRAPAEWAQAYPAAGFQVVHRDNYLPFVMGTTAT
jgi:predicted AAA+ superfamily ATPase